MGKRRITALFLSVFVLLGITELNIRAVESSTGFENFKKQNMFSEEKFSDVHQNDWFYEDVGAVYQYGLMLGNSESTFAPYGKVTIAEAIAIAARLHAIYYGKEIADSSLPWYQPYVDYAENEGINLPGLDDYERIATRAEYAGILALAFPDEALVSLNAIDDGMVPDVKLDDPYGASIYKLYRAGILVGSDTAGTFWPENDISRSEVATIVSRMVEPERRIHREPSESDGSTDTPVDKPGENTNTSEAGNGGPEVVVPDAPTFIVSTEEASAGDTDIPVTIRLKNNPGIASIGMLVSFESALTLNSMEYSTEIGGQFMEPEKMGNPVKLVWLSPFEDVSGDWVFVTLYFNVSETAESGSHQISISYNPDDIYDITENNIAFNTVYGGIYVN